jgi:hypothetical protein
LSASSVSFPKFIFLTERSTVMLLGNP